MESVKGKIEIPILLAGASWQFIFFAAAISSITFTFAVAGYRWSTELAAAVLSILSFTCLFFVPRREIVIGTQDSIFIIIPGAVFTLWSALSIFWSASTRAAIHHTLLWACYLLVFVTIRQSLPKPRVLEFTLKLLTLTVLVICFSGLIDYFGTPGPTTYRFTAQYYLYSEAFAAFLPLLFALVLVRQGKWAIISAVCASSIWTLILATMSRAMFLSSVIGIAAFLAMASCKRNVGKTKRLWSLLAVFLVITASFSILKRTQQVSVADRFLGNDPGAVESTYSRIFYWKLATEAFRTSPIIGIGADNFFSNYRQLREKVIADYGDAGDSLVTEDLIPDRAHNEYLQILAELGIVGFAIFCFLILGIFYICFKSRPLSLIQVAAFSGMLAFLASSSMSSYSFRFPTGGLSFFFLLAVFFPEGKPKWVISPSRAAVLMILPLMFSVFSAIRGLSIYYLSRSVVGNDRVAVERDMKTALRLDNSDPMFKAYYAQMLDLWNRPEEAVINFRYAIDHGMANSTTYFGLCSTYLLLEKDEDADLAFQEATRIYPRSVFLQTAYAAFLKQHGNLNKSNQHYQIAESVDAKQAVSWELAHEQGLASLSRISLRDPNYLKVQDLLPLNGPLALANYQQVFKNP